MVPHTTDSTQNSVIIVVSFFVSLIVMALCACKCFYLFRQTASKPTKRREFLGKKNNSSVDVLAWFAGKTKIETKKVGTPEPGADLNVIVV